jgi:uroporphyrinogen-III synthase
VIAYESVNLPLPSKLAGALADRPVVLLHSAAAAAHFAHECRRLGLDRGSITIAALGPRIASAAGQGWRAIHVAASPNDAFLLEMVHETCL